MSKPWQLIAGAVIVIGVVVAATDDPASREGSPREPTRSATNPVPSPTLTATTSTPSKSESSVLLASLRTVDRSPVGVPPYERSAFGSRWADVDRNGCNQRDDVLLRDVKEGTVTVQRQGRCPHDVIAGTWPDPYTGKTLTFTDLKEPKQSVAIQIDHIVPLAEAWRSGASDWSDERRRQYANDLDNLLAVDGPTNQSKSAFDPASWKPRAAFQCTYAERWIDVKHRWDLAADTSEVNALREMLATC